MAKKRVLLSVIIVSFNAEILLPGCLSSLFDSFKEKSFEVLVIDNNSQDNTGEFLEKNFPQVTLIKNKTNLGFAKAVNQGLVRALGEYIFLLNPDTLVSKNSLNILLEVMEKNKEIGIVGPKILSPNGEFQRSAFPPPSLLREICDILGKFRLEKILPANWTNRYFDKRAQTAKEPFEVGWLQGSALLIRKKTIDDIGFFDENFFLFSEDVDFCQRAKKKDWKVVFAPQASIIHLGGYSGKTNLEGLTKRIEFNYSRRFYFAQKNWGILSVYLVKIVCFFDLILRIFALTLTNPWRAKSKETEAKLKGYKKGFFSIFTQVQK
jgi:GT2 family glycosyltransferase